jgi:hypothetical protein
MVEFALISVVFFTLFIGVIEVGRLLYGLSAISNAAREGARYGIAYSNPHTSASGKSACVTGAGMTAAALQAAQGVGTETGASPDLVVTAQELPNPAVGGSTVPPVSCKVTVLWHFKPASGFFSLIKPVDYTSTTTLYFYSITQ